MGHLSISLSQYFVFSYDFPALQTSVDSFIYKKDKFCFLNNFCLHIFLFHSKVIKQYLTFSNDHPVIILCLRCFHSKSRKLIKMILQSSTTYFSDIFPKSQVLTSYDVFKEHLRPEFPN